MSCSTLAGFSSELSKVTGVTFKTPTPVAHCSSYILCVRLWFCWHRSELPFLCSHPPGLSPAGALRGDSHPGRGGEAHHPEGQEPAPAPVRPAGLRVRAAHPGREPPGDGPALQQLQRAVPEQLGTRGHMMPASSLCLFVLIHIVVLSARKYCRKYSQLYNV